MKQQHRIYAMAFASVYPLYVAKAVKKGRTKKEVDEIINWLTGYDQKQLEAQIVKDVPFEDFFAQALTWNRVQRAGWRYGPPPPPLDREFPPIPAIVAFP
ncbi:DUF2200 family protein [Patescibacteria group bacterium]|nr:MAG: DUF2200 family protein [Patescibacteria group bacterium]